MRRAERHPIARLNAAGCLPLLVLIVLIAGCGGGGGGNAGAPLDNPGVPVSGTVHGGQNPVSGAQVFAYQAGSSGYGKGDVKLACTTTNASGQFSFGAASPPCAGTGLSAALLCPAAGSPQIYFLALGGNPGSGVNNPALAMLAAVGNCNALPAGAFVTINEVTTVASVWALSQFMNCASGAVDGAAAGCTANSRDIGTSRTNATGLANAMSGAANLANFSTGLARTPGANGINPPTNELNTLADILQDCVNSTGGASTACHNLFSCVVPGATPGVGNLAPCTVPAGGVLPADTLTAAADIARNPNNNAVTLFNLTSKTPAFTPPLASAPNDWSVALNYQGGGLNGPDAIAIDAAGTAWVTNVSSNSVTKISAAGSFLTGSTGLTGDGLNGLGGIAIDPSGNAWITNSGNSPTTGSVTEISGSGPFVAPISGCPGATFCVYIEGGLMTPVGIAIDSMGDAWVENLSFASVTEISYAGSFLSPTSGCPGTAQCGYTGGGLNFPQQIAFDAFGNAWITNSGNNSVTELNPAGIPLSPSSGCPGATNCGYTGGGLKFPGGIALDLNNNAWIVNSASLTEISSGGTFISPSSGCPGTTNCGYTGGGLNQPHSIAIDSGGKVFVANLTNSVTELSPAANFLSGNNGYKGGGLNQPVAIAADASGNLWLPNSGGAGNSVTEFVGLAAPVMTPAAACLALQSGRPICLP